MACTVIYNGQEITVEDFAQQLYDGGLDTLINEGRIDKAKLLDNNFDPTVNNSPHAQEIADIESQLAELDANEDVSVNQKERDRIASIQPTSLKSIVRNALMNGAKLIFKDKNTEKGIASELGLSGAIKEGLANVIDQENGMSIGKLADRINDNYPELDNQEIRNAIINVIQDGTKRMYLDQRAELEADTGEKDALKATLSERLNELKAADDIWQKKYGNLGEGKSSRRQSTIKDKYNFDFYNGKGTSAAYERTEGYENLSEEDKKNFEYDKQDNNKIKSTAEKIVKESDPYELYNDIINGAIKDKPFEIALVITLSKQVNLDLVNNPELKSLSNKLNTLRKEQSKAVGQDMSIFSTLYDDPTNKVWQLLDEDDAKIKDQLNQIGVNINEVKKEIISDIDDAKSEFTNSDEFKNAVKKEAEKIAKEQALLLAKQINKSTKEKEESFRKSRKEQFKKDQSKYFNSTGLPFLNEAGISYGIDIAKSYIREGITDIEVIRRKLDLFFNSESRIVKSKDIDKIIDSVKDDKSLIEKDKSKIDTDELVERFIKETFNNSGLNKDQSTNIINNLRKSVSDINKEDITDLEKRHKIESEIKALKKKINEFKSGNKLNEGDFTEKSIEKFITDSLINAGETLSSTSKKSYIDRQKDLEGIIDSMADYIGYEKSHLLIDELTDIFNNYVAKKSTESLRKALISSGRTLPKIINNDIVKYTHNKLLQLINQGALKTDEFDELIYNLLGVSNIPPFERAVLIEYANNINKYDFNTLKDPKKQELSQKIQDIEYKYKALEGTAYNKAITKFLRQYGIRDFFKNLTRIQITNMLGGPNTLLRNELSVFHKFANSLAIDSIINKSRGKYNKEDLGKLSSKELNSLALNVLGRIGTTKIIKDLVVGYTQSVSMLIRGFKNPSIRTTGGYIMKTGFNIADSAIEANRTKGSYEKYVDRHIEQVMTKEEWNGLNPVAKNIMRSILTGSSVNSRVMLARDAMNRYAMMDYFVISDIVNNELFGLDPGSYEWAKMLSDKTIEYTNSKDVAIELATEVINNLISEGDKTVSKGQILPLAYEILRQEDKRLSSIQYATERTRIMTEQNNVTGMAGVLYNSVLKPLSNIPIIGKMTIAFPRVAMNLLNGMLNRSPIGIARAYAGGSLISQLVDKKGIISRQEILQSDWNRREQLTQGVLGTSTMVALALIMSQIYWTDDDNEDEKEGDKYSYIPRETRKLIKKEFNFKYNLQDNSINFTIHGKQFDISYANLFYAGVHETLATMQAIKDEENKNSKENEKEKDVLDLPVKIVDSFSSIIAKKMIGDPSKSLASLYVEDKKGKNLAAKYFTQQVKRLIPGVGSSLLSEATKVATYNMPAPKTAKYTQSQSEAIYKTFGRNTPLVFFDDDKAVDAIGNPVRNNFNKSTIAPLIMPIYDFVDMWEKDKIFSGEEKDKWIYKLGEDTGLPVNKIDYSRFNPTISMKTLEPIIAKVKFKFSDDIKKWYPKIESASFDDKYNVMVGEEYKRLLYKNKNKLESNIPTNEPENKKESKEGIIKYLKSQAKSNVNNMVSEQLSNDKEAIKLFEQEDIINENKSDWQSELNVE